MLGVLATSKPSALNPLVLGSSPTRPTISDLPPEKSCKALKGKARFAVLISSFRQYASRSSKAAADALIAAVAEAEGKYGKGDRRTVMIHAQTVREDQLDRMKELGIVPSFFSMHTYYWVTGIATKYSARIARTVFRLRHPPCAAASSSRSIMMRPWRCRAPS